MKNKFRLIRHATLQLSFNGINFLVDPMLSPKDAMDPIANAANDRRIPMVDLPLSDDQLSILLSTIDAVLVTHTHRDHWDEKAQNLLNKNITLFCQPADTDKIRASGFTNVIPITNHISFKGIEIYRTGGHHGKGEIEEKMGEVSGFVLKDSNNSIYIAGDTIWCTEVEQALLKHEPDVAVLNSGAPRYLTGEPITMTSEDVISSVETIQKTKFVAVHMETINHCTLNRAQLKDALKKAGLQSRVDIPEDGDYF